MIIAGIVAGGTGSRMGNGDLPKQFWELSGKPIFLYTAEKFLEYTDIVIIGMNPDWLDYAEQLLQQYMPDCQKIFLVKGGSDRNETVSNIIAFAREHCQCHREDIILTHDAVRPFVTGEIIRNNLSAISECDICTTAIPATDTIVVSADGHTADTFPERSKMFLVQTPQTFRIGDFTDIYRTLSDDEKQRATDVCRLFQAKSKKVMLVLGEPSNIKLTYPYDYQVAQLIAMNI